MSRRRRLVRAPGFTELLEVRQLLVATWQPAGPSGLFGGQTENVPGNRVSGAIQTVLTHPTDAGTAWIATVNGGIWKTTNLTAANPTWTPLTDEFASLSFGALSLDPTVSNSSVLWAGSGRFSSLGQDGGARIGLFKSTTGGSSWVGVAGNATMAGRNISGIAARGNTITVGVNVADVDSNTNFGIFRSTNGGTSFTQISGLAGSGLPRGRSYDLVGDPLNNNVLYTSIWDGTADGVYKSVNSGATWTRVSSAAMHALIGSGTSNMEMSVGRNNNVYIGIINQGQLAGLFRSGNGGSSWTQLDTPVTNENGTIVGIHPRPKGPAPGSPSSTIAGGQGYIHFSITADPVDHNIVYVGGDRQPLEQQNPNSIGATEFAGRLFRVNASRPVGSQFIALTHSPTTNSNSAPHADSRDMAFAANGWLIEVDDGGIYKRTNPRTTGDWFGLHGNLQNSEIHSIAYDSRSNVLIAGTQDVGTPVQRPGTLQWDSLTTGDGGVVEVDPLSLAAQNRSVRYSSFFRLGQLRKSIVSATNTVISTSFPALTVAGAGVSLFQFDTQIPFYAPIVLNAVNPVRGLVLTNNVYESFNQFDSITALAGGSAPLRAFAYGGAGNADVIYVGNTQGLFVRTTFGAGFTQITSYGGQEPLDLTLDPDNWQTGFVMDSNQVFRFTGNGTTVVDVTGNLASQIGTARLRSIVYVPSASGDGIVVGTDIGTFLMRANSPGQWISYGPNLPNTIAYDLKYDRTDDVLIVGTLGRGAWRVPNASDTIANVAPVLTLPTSTLSYTEDGALVYPGDAGTISDADSSNFAGGTLRARVSVNGEATDRLIIGNATGVTTNAAGDVFINGVNIGSFTGGAGTGQLTITLNSAATVSRVQTLLRGISFRTVSDQPSTSQRTILFQVTDGDGGSSANVTRRVNVARANDQPVITPDSTAALNYVANSTPGVLLLNNADLTDPDSANLATGVLTINYATGSSTANRIEPSGRYSFSGTQVLLDGTTLIGTRNTNGGVGTAVLNITFNSAATPARIELLLRSLRFRTVSAATGQRQIRFRISDGDGGTSDFVIRTINVTAPPSAPDAAASLFVTDDNDDLPALASLATSRDRQPDRSRSQRAGSGLRRSGTAATSFETSMLTSLDDLAAADAGSDLDQLFISTSVLSSLLDFPDA